MTEKIFFIGLDDTDAPQGMCTTWLGALLARILEKKGMQVLSARLVRLNPTIPYKTRGNAAISLKVMGDPVYAFTVACDLVAAHAELSCENTHPGVVVSTIKPPDDFYWQAVCDICTIENARTFLDTHDMMYRGFKLGRGLIGATAAVCSRFPDYTWELLSYRSQKRFCDKREYHAPSFHLSELITTPHTWDTWDSYLESPVCIPHTPDPVLCGIRGDSPISITYASSFIRSEPPDFVQIWMTNQGTDAHLVPWKGEPLRGGISYLIRGFVHDHPKTSEGGHVSVSIEAKNHLIPCMAYEPTKTFRNLVRLLRPGDEILIAGSYLKQSVNLEKFYLFTAHPYASHQPPVCPSCNKRMTSAGSGKGYKCKKCGRRGSTPATRFEERSITPGWYEVPPGARRHLSRPLIRGFVSPDPSYLPVSHSDPHC